MERIGRTMNRDKNEASTNGGGVAQYKQESHTDTVTTKGTIMALAGLDALEMKIQGLLKVIQSLKQKNTSLEGEITTVRQRLESQEDLNRLLEQEHTDVQSRIEKVLDDIKRAELINEPEEVSQ